MLCCPDTVPGFHGAESSLASAKQLVLVDDDKYFLRAIEFHLLELFPEMKIVPFGFGKPALDYCLHHQISVLIVDCRLPDIHGVDIVRQLRGAKNHCRVLVVTASPNDHLLQEFWKLGVSGFLDKASLFEHLPVAVEKVLAGGIYFSAKVQRMATAPSCNKDDLSKRQLEVAQLVASGFLSKQIAAELGLSTRTVEKYRARVMQKLGVHSIPGLVRWCLQHEVTVPMKRGKESRPVAQ